MVLKSVTISNPFFHVKIINKNQKWKRIAVNYPFLEYNISSSIPKILKSKINLYLSFRFRKQNLKLFNVISNSLSSALIQFKTSLYQSKTETATKNILKTFLLSIKGNAVNIDNISNINHIVELLRSGASDPDTTLIIKNRQFPKSSLLDNRFQKFITESRHSCIEGKMTNKIERMTNKTVNQNLLFVFKKSQDLSNLRITECLKNLKLLGEIDFLKNIALLRKLDFIRNIATLQVLKLLSGKKNIDNRNLFSDVGSLRTITFSIYADCWSKQNFPKIVFQPRNILISKASNKIYSQDVAEKSFRMHFFDSKKLVGLKTIDREHRFAQKSNTLNTDKIRNLFLSFTLRLPEKLPKQIFSEFPKSTNIFKKLNFLKDNDFIKTESSLKSTITLIILNSSIVKNRLYNKYYSDQNNNLNNNFFSTGTYHWSNLGFSKTVLQLRNIFIKTASNYIHSQEFAEKQLKLDFSDAKKVIGFRTEGGVQYFTQKLKLLKALGSENALPEFERIKAFSSHLHDPYSDNLTFSQKKTQFPTLISQIPANGKINPMLSLLYPEFGNKKLVSISERKELLISTYDSEIPDVESGKLFNFQKRSENLIFHTQSDMEQKIEERIEQKIGQRIEKIKKSLDEAKEAFTEQSRSDYLGNREHQKQYLDVNYISDQVFRQMERRLKIERERRGIL